MAIRVSVVEDDAQTRELLAGRINRSRESTCVSDHRSAEEALDQLPAIRLEIVLMDINLAGRNGPECVRQLKPLLPEAQFLMVTIYEDSGHIFQALQAGASSASNFPRWDTPIRRIYEKLHVRSRSEASARYAHLPLRPVVNTTRP